MRSRDQSQRTTQEGGTCYMPKGKGKSAQVVIIDIDQIDCSHVGVMDIPETSQRKYKCFSELKTNGKGSAWNVISIDDDDVDSDITSSRKNIANEKKNLHCFTEKSDGEDSSMLYEQSNLPFKCSTSSGKVRPRNRFGLDFDSEVSSSDSDNSDCEVMDGTSGEIREQWEKAASKKKSLEDQTSTSEACINSQKPQQRKSSKNLDRDTNDIRSYSETSVQSNSDDDMDNQANNNLSADNPFSQHDDDYMDSQADHNLPTDNPIFQHDDVSLAKGSSQFADQDCQKDKNDLVSETQDASNAHTGYEAEFDHENGSAINRTKSCPEEHFTFQVEGLDHIQQRKDVTEGPCSEDILVSRTEIDHEGSNFEEKQDYEEDHVLNTNRDEVIGSSKELALGEFSHHEDGTAEDVSELNFLIGGRERLKETEEYKRAQEEEWRNRQHQLQLQAEEARQLRKRKKAVLRLLDMEKRQKQRVEEIRESQKKDEETINLKEQLRIEVRKELEILELKCMDMAELLRALGINVEGGPHPKTHEIRAAYKQALLRYHPDRSSKASIRQQVEAEEAFKLISRLKEKLLTTA